MSYKTGTEMYNYILRSFNRTDKETEAYEAMTDTIRDIRRKVILETDKEIGYTTAISTSGEYNFELPADFNHLLGDIKILDNDSSYPLTRISKKRYDQLEPYPDYSGVDTGKPTKYCLYGNAVFLYPVPDETSYTYEFNYSIDDEVIISSSTTEVPYTDRNREIVKYGTLARLYEGLELYEESELFDQKYEIGLLEMMDREYDNTSSVGFTRFSDI